MLCVRLRASQAETAQLQTHLKAIMSLLNPLGLSVPHAPLLLKDRQQAPKTEETAVCKSLQSCAVEEAAIVLHGSRTGPQWRSYMRIWVNVRKTIRSLGAVQKYSWGCLLRCKNWGLVVLYEPHVHIGSSYKGISAPPTAPPTLPCGAPAAGPTVRKMNGQSPHNYILKMSPTVRVILIWS